VPTPEVTKSAWIALELIAQPELNLPGSAGGSGKHTMGDRMLGSQCILALKQFVLSTAVLEKIYHLNAARILKIKQLRK